LTATINKIENSAINGITAVHRTYDATTDAALDLSGVTFAGIVGGDTLSVADYTAAFDDKNAGEHKPVTYTVSPRGRADAGNYLLAEGAQTGTTTASISKRGIYGVGGLKAADRVYDGTTGVTLDWSDVSLYGAIAGDDLEVAGAVGAFRDENAGTKTVD